MEIVNETLVIDWSLGKVSQVTLASTMILKIWDIRIHVPNENIINKVLIHLCSLSKAFAKNIRIEANPTNATVTGKVHIRSHLYD